MDERLKLTDPSLQVRQEAAEALSYMGPDAAPAVVELVRACDDDESVQQWAVAALEEVGPPPTDSLKELTSIAGDGKSLSAYWAVTLLGRAGESASDAESVLIDLLKTSSDTALQERSVWALGKVHACSADAVAALKEASNSNNPRLASLANESLAKAMS